MKLCYNCFRESEDSARFCEHCGCALDSRNQEDFPDSLPLGTTLFGRYLTGRVLGRDSLFITYIARDSRSGDTVVIKELFPPAAVTRGSSQSLIPREGREDVFTQIKDLLLEKAEALSSMESEESAAGLQSGFRQNDTIYLAVRYTDKDSLSDYLKQMEKADFRGEAAGLLEDTGQSLEFDLESGQEKAGRDDPSAAKSLFTDIIVPENPDRHEVSTTDIPDRPVPEEEVSPGREDDAGREVRSGSGLRDSLSVIGHTGESDSGSGTGESAMEDSQTVISEPQPPAPDNTGTALPQSGQPAADPGGKKKSSPVPALIVMALLLAAAAAIGVLIFRLSSGLIGHIPDRYEIQWRLEQWTRNLTKKAEEPDESHKSDKTDKTDKTDNTDKTDKTDNHVGIDRIRQRKPGTGELILPGKEGITAGNFLNSGILALLDGDIYFARGLGLYRCRESDPENMERILIKNTAYLNIYNGFIYYIDEYEGSIYRCDPDGNNLTQVYDSSSYEDLIPESLYVQECGCYFSNGRNLFRLDTQDLESGLTADEEDVELVAEDFNYGERVYPSLCFFDGRLWYNGSSGVTAADPYGHEMSRISSLEGHLLTDGSCILCWTGSGDIYRIEADGKTTQILDLPASERIRKCNCRDGWLYYIMEKEGGMSLWKMRTDGTQPEHLREIGTSEEVFYSLCTFEESDYIYANIIRKEGGIYQNLVQQYPAE